MIYTIDLDDIEHDTLGTLARLRTGMRDVGVVYVTAPRLLTTELECHVFEDAASLFALPTCDKRALDVAGSPNFRGYVGMRAEYTNGVPDLKESFEFARETRVPTEDPAKPYFRLYGDNLWPDARLLPRFRLTIAAYSDAVGGVGLAVLRALARTLDQSVAPGVSGGLFQGDLCSFSRLIHYSDPTAFSEMSARLEAHTDHTLLTMILQNTPALAIRIPAGAWVEVQPPPGAFVVFCGELMEYWTRGYYRACTHRVHNSALRSARLSVSSFFLPDMQSTIEPIRPDSSPHLRDAAPTVSDDNSWLREDRDLRPIDVGMEEWRRVQAIFPQDSPRPGEARQPRQGDEH